MALANIIVALDVLAFCAAIAMAYQAHKAHRVLQTQVSLAFSTCFWLIGAGLFVHVLSDASIGLAPVLEPAYALLTLIGALLLLSGYALLLLVVEKVESHAMWVLTFVLVLFAGVFTNNLWSITNLLAIIILSLLAHRFYNNFLRTNSQTALTVYLAFIFLVAAHLAGFLALFNLSAQVAYLGLSLVAYFMLFAVSWRVTR